MEQIAELTLVDILKKLKTLSDEGKENSLEFAALFKEYDDMLAEEGGNGSIDDATNYLIQVKFIKGLKVNEMIENLHCH